MQYTASNPAPPNELVTETIKPVTDREIELFSINLSNFGGSTQFFIKGAVGSAGVTWRGDDYVPFDFETEGFDLSSDGGIATPKVKFATSNLFISAMLASYNDLVGATITRTRTYYKFLDDQPTADPSAHFPIDIYRIDRKANDNRIYVEFELSSILDQQGKKLPGRLMIANYCQWKYRTYNGGVTGDPLLDFNYNPTDKACPYTGNVYYDDKDQITTAANDKCSYLVSGCKQRFGSFAELPYGAFPGVARPTIS